MKRVVSNQTLTASKKTAKHDHPYSSKEELLKVYISDLKDFENIMESSVANAEGKVAHFWYNNDSGYYTLVLELPSTDDAYWITDETYWGDEELIDYNDIPLTAAKLYNIIMRELPDFTISSFYGMSDVFKAYSEFYRQAI